MLLPEDVAFRLDAELLHTEVGLAVTEVGNVGKAVTETVVLTALAHPLPLVYE